MTEKATKESGLQRHIGIKKYGKKGFEELQKAGREGASEEEKGAIKDKHLPKKKTNEGLADLADMAERDHEVQMARSDLYKIAKYAIKLHEMMKNVSEAEGIEGWQQAKITKAADYLGSVYHALDYDTKFESVQVPEDAKPKQHKRVLSDSEVSSYKGDLASKLEEKSKGLYYYVNKNKKSGKKPRPKGHPDAPSDQDWKDAAKTAKESVEGVCEDCGNPSWTTLPEEKKKGSHGKVCWKGYRRGKGNSCHKVKGDG